MGSCYAPSRHSAGRTFALVEATVRKIYGSFFDMMTRMVVLGAAVAALVACGPARPTPDAGTGGGTGGGATGGGTGGGNTGGGGGTTGGGGGGTIGGGTGGGSMGGGTGGGSSFAWDGGTTIDAVRGARFCTENVTVENVIVSGIEYEKQGSQGDWLSQFWVQDLNDPRRGMYVDKFYTDLPGPLRVKVGDVLTLKGYVKRQSAYNDRRAYRFTFGNQYGCGSSLTGKLEITVVDAGTPAINMVTLPFGDAQNGNARPNPEYGSTRVSIPGPLVLTNPAPTAFRRISQRANDTTVYGFEVSGGILVNNFATYDIRHSDGGVTVRCDWRAIAADAGNGTVVFPNGISGIWDTYSHAPCRDGGTSCPDGFSNRDSGIVPGTNNEYTYVLYPTSCEDLPGYLDAGR
jgi:hypothetical protein